MKHTIYTIGERPEFEDETYRINAKAWPNFMFEDPVADQYWGRLYTFCHRPFHHPQTR